MRRSLYVWLSVLIAVSPLLLALPPREAEAAVGAQIVGPTYASGVRYSGQAAASTLQVKNSGTAADTLWVRYTVTDKAGKERNLPAVSVSLGAGQLSGTITRTWTVPDPVDPSVLTTGFYAAGFSVYDANPDTNAAARLLDSDEQPNAFRAFNFLDQFSTFDTTRWFRGDHGLGFIREQGPDEPGCGTIGPATNVLYASYLNPANVALSGTGQLQMRLPAGPSSNPCANVEGAEIESADYYRYGTYEIRMQLPDAPSSITGFFLYGGDGVAEIDIEAFNEKTTDPDTGAQKGKVMFTTYSKNPDGSPNYTPTHTTNGEPGNEPPLSLPFDPTAGMHIYRFDLYPGSVRFYVDGVMMKEWTDGLPSDKMKLLLNSWYPRWMSQTAPPEDRFLNVEWIRH
ncbi:glycoside hydrolase family 16 protein [Rubrobacter tropicus]|uniref:glycoside hydrolase family 16 protein n=1 Tax=Rubrobacter tropicus TaxID=2653851 RepID=UPI001D190DC8|nr:glycoside hydrolase family 16 protein [Rubrobacter tropicus]